MPGEKKTYTQSQYIGTAIFSSAILTPVRHGLNFAGAAKNYSQLFERFKKLPWAGFSGAPYNIARGGGTTLAQLNVGESFEGNTKVLVIGGVATVILTATETPFIRQPYLPVAEMPVFGKPSLSVAEAPLAPQRLRPPLLIANPTLSLHYGLRECLYAKIVFNTDLPTLKGQSRRERVEFACDISKFVGTYGFGAWTSAMFHKLIVFHALEGLDDKLPNFRRDGFWPTLAKIGKNEFASVGLQGYFALPQTKLKVALNTAYSLCPPVLFGMRVVYLGAAKFAIYLGFKGSEKIAEYPAAGARFFSRAGAGNVQDNLFEAKMTGVVPGAVKKR